MLARPDGDILITTIQTKSVLSIRKQRESKMYKNRLLQLVVVVVMLMAVAASGVAVRSASAANPDEVPFKASVSGIVIPPSPDSPTLFSLEGAGKASYLGPVDPYRAAGELTEFDDEGVPTADILIETLHAADGSGTLTIRCEQVLKQIRPNVFRGTDKWEVIGGTDRFSGAEGSGTGVTNVDLNVGTFTKNLKGNIIFPNGD